MMAAGLSPNLRGSSHGASWRWILPITFLLGFASTYQSFGPMVWAYGELTLISSAAAMLLMFFLRSVKPYTLPLWIVLGIFLISYYVKFYVAVLVPDTVTNSIISGLVNTEPLNPDLLLDSFSTMVYGYIAFCLTAISFCLWSEANGLSQFQRTGPLRYGSISNRCLLVAFLVGVPASVLVDKFSLVMGGDTRLPFHLNAFISFAEGMTAPMFLMGALDAALQTSRKARVSITISFVLAYSVVGMVLTASKGALFRVAIYLALLWFIGGHRVSRRRALYFVGLLVAAVLAFPVIGVYRSLVTSQGEGAQSGLTKAIAIAYQDPLSTLSTLGWFILERVVGADIVMGLIDHHTHPFGIGILWRELIGGTGAGVPGALTVQWYGTSSSGGAFANTLAPSLLGEFYAALGDPGVILGVALFTASLMVTWRWLYRKPLLSRNAVLASFLVLVCISAEEGTVVMLLRSMVVFIPSAIGLELIYRHAAAARRGQEL